MFAGRTRLAVIGAAALAVAALVAYWLYAAQQKREQQRAVSALIGDTTVRLRQALTAAPSADLLSTIDSNLQAAKAPRDPALADAAEHYILGAREIVRRRGDSERLAREAAMSRRALAMHMAAAARRDTYWIRVATDLKKKVERDHSDLDRSLKALYELLGTLPDAQKQLAPHVDASLLLEETERRSARERAEQAAKRAAEELEKARRLAPR